VLGDEYKQRRERQVLKLLIAHRAALGTVYIFHLFLQLPFSLQLPNFY
jgi:hypothetical protein